VSAFTRLAQDDSGATAVEYGLVIGGIAALIIVAVYALGAKVNNLYSHVTSKWTP
jgi:pilus assembly protein Flp/PilA